MQPLTRRLDDEAPPLVDKRDPGIGLQIGVFLPSRAEAAFEDDVRARECGRRISLANPLMQQHIVAFGMHAWRAGAHRLARIRYALKIVICDVNERCSLRGGRGRARRDERDAISGMAHDVVTQDRLVRFDETVAVERHVARRKDRDDVRYRECCERVDRENARVRAAREDGPEVEHARANQIGGIACRTGYLRERIRPRVRCTDVTHGASGSCLRTSACAAACSIA